MKSRLKSLLKLLAISLCILSLFATPSIMQLSSVYAQENQDNSQVEERKITVDLQGGKLNDSEEDIQIDMDDYSTLTLEVPTRENYAFYGYYTQPNAAGVKYYNYLGKREKGISLENNPPEKLYATWVKTVSTVKIPQSLDISYYSGHVHTQKYNVGLDIEKLKEVGYQKIEVNMKYTLRAEDKGTGRDMWFDLLTNGDYVAKQMLLDDEGMYYTDWTDSYTSAYFEIEKFNNDSKFQFGFNQRDFYLFHTATWKFKDGICYFSAADKPSENPLTSSQEILNTNLYTLEDNTGYNINGISPNGSPLGEKYANISLHVSGGNIIKGSVENNIQQYGYYFDDNFSQEQMPSISFKLNYNYASKENIHNSSWNLSEDTFCESINGIENVGVVQSGALIVQKLKQGGDPSVQGDWTWKNPLINGVTQSFHTVDFVNNYSPTEYDGKSHFVKRIEPVIKREDDGGYVYKYENDKIVGVEYVKSEGYFVTQEVYKNIDGNLPIFTPSGEDLKNGGVFRVLFAYEVYKGKQYKNIVEETTIAIYPATAKILFQNMDFYTADSSGNENIAHKSELVRNFGEVKNGHSVNDGFKVNFNGNTTYTVEYYKNDATNLYDKKYAKDGQVFVEPGKYRFIVTPVVGEPRETIIYINERGISHNLANYFGESFISKNSQRVFSQVDSVPVYMAGETFWQTQAYSPFLAPLVGRIGLYIGMLEEHNELKTDDKGNDYYVKYIEYNNQVLYENVDYFKQVYNDDQDNEQSMFFKIVEKVDASDRLGHSGAFTETGFYLCEFANNVDYLNNQSAISGDVYLFTFQFEIVDDAEAPQINKSLLNANLSFVDYKSKYYGVSIPTKGRGKAVYAFASYQDAYDFAYDYFRSLAKKVGDNYIFNNQTFSSVLELFKEIQRMGRLAVEEKYFDASDPNSYVTISDKIEDVTSLNIDQDIIVFDKSLSSFLSAINEPFLNDRPYAYLQENKIESGFNSLQFIQVEPCESSIVTITSMKGDLSWVIPYGVSIQAFLMSNNAPSGRYKITEENHFDITEYYGIYIKPGDNSTKLDITRVNGKTQTRQSLSKSNANIRFEYVNGLILHSASNQMDPYGIIKIKNLSTGEVVIKQLDEIKDYKIVEQGHYQIDCVDRLGNVISYFADIYDSAKFYDLTFKNGEKVETVNVAGGTRVTLTVPENDDEQLEFAGWQDEDGRVLTENYFYYDYTKSVTLTALWHYKNTKVLLYDGKLLEKYETKPGELLNLKDLYGQNQDGLSYFRYVYEDDTGKKHFYLPQMQSVPNSQVVRLDVLWMDSNNSVRAKNGEELQTPATKLGYQFYGYIYSASGTQHYLFDKVVEWPNDEELTLYALYVKEENYTDIMAGIAAGNALSNTESKVLNVLGSPVSIATSSGVLCILLALIIAFACRKKQKNRYRNQLTQNLEVKVIPKSEEKVAVTTTNKVPTYRIKRPKRKIELPKLTFDNFVKPAVSFMFSFMFLFVGCYNLIISSKTKHEIDVAQVTVERQLEEYQTAKRLEQEQSEKIAHEVTQVKEFVADERAMQETISGDVSGEYSNEEAFLYGLVYVKLTELGYTVFAATATNPDGSKVSGFAYYDPINLDYYSNEDDDILYISSGFVAFLEQEPIDDSGEGAVIIEPKQDTVTFADYDENSFKFVLTFGEQIASSQYIANEKYVVYSIHDSIIDVSTNEYVGDGSSLFKNPEMLSKVELLGYLYNYDTDSVMYDYVGQEFDFSAYSTIAGVDYDAAIDSYLASVINLQNENFVQVNNFSVVALSVEAIHDYVIHNQDESYLGIDTQQIYQIEAQIDDAIFYYVNGETGSISQLSIKERLQQYKDEHDGKASENTWRILSYVLSALSVVSGIILCFLPIGTQGLGISLIIGGVTGALCETFKDDISKFMLNAVGQKGAQAIGAAGSIVVGGVTIKIGANIAKGPGWFKVLGALICLIGLASGGFGISEMGEVLFDYNFMKSWFGVSDLVYSNIYRAFNYASTVIIIANILCINVLKTINLHKIAKLQGKTIRQMFKDLANATGISLKDLHKMSPQQLKSLIDQLSDDSAELSALAQAAGKTPQELKKMSPEEWKEFINSADEKELQALTENTKKTVDQLRQMDQKTFDKFIDKVRSKAVKQAKAQELEYLRYQQEYFDTHGQLPPDANGNIPDVKSGWGSLNNIPQQHAEWILQHGRFPSYKDGLGIQYEGHHMYSVDFAKETGKFSSIVDPNNIAIGERMANHYLWHNRNWQIHTEFITSSYGNIYSINRANLLENITNIIGRK